MLLTLEDVLPHIQALQSMRNQNLASAEAYNVGYVGMVAPLAPCLSIIRYVTITPATCVIYISTF